MDNAFASLAHIRILLLPVGNIERPTFERWAEEIKEFEEIRLSDVPADSRDDRARFMPNPLATGSLLLSFTEHPPAPSSSKLDLFRPSDFPLGIVGVASCSQSDVLSSIYSHFNASRGELFPPDSIYPLAHNCFVFEEGDGNTNLNVGNHMPGLVVIPSMMGNKKLYIGTLLAELCSNILGEFSMMVRTLETPSGSDALNAGMFARMPNYRANRASLDAEEAGRPSSVASSLHSLPDRGSGRQTDPRLNVKRASTLGPGVMGSNNRAFQQVSQMDKKRQSVLSSATGSHARLYKVLGDLFLLAGRTMDASIWYNEAAAVLKGSQDLPWQASALEGMAVAGLLEVWSSSHSSPADSWSDLGDKLSRATSLYAAAADAADSEGRISELSFLYIRACLRHASLMFYVWLGNGFNTLSFDALLHGRFGARDIEEKLRLSYSSSITGLSRSAISEVLTQAHGPWLLHLGPRERLEALRRLGRMYSGLRYRRKEAYILRELVACLLDLLIQGREETKGTSDFSLGLSDESRPRGDGSVGVREREDVVGNASILRVVRYICEVHGIDLDSIGFAKIKSANGVRSPRNSNPEVQQATHAILRQSLLRYTWPELQVGLIREALAVAEALPDYPSVASFALSALRDLYTLLEPEDQFHLHTAASRAMGTVRRRGDERKLEYWPIDLVVNVRFTPLPFIRLPQERPWADIQSRVETSEQATRADPFLFNPRRALNNKRQVFAVANEDLDFVVMLDNPYAVSLELLEVELSTTGVPFLGRPRSVVIQGNSSETVTLSGQATESGTLVVRGCKVLLPGVERHEIILPTLSEEEEEDRFLKSVAQFNEGEKSKSPSLNDRFDKKRKHISAVLSEASDKSDKASTPSKFLELKVVPEQPCLRIRRTSLTNGAVMLYDGETSTIRLTVENISNLPIDFLELTFDDSTRPQLEQVMNDDTNAFEKYEAEHCLVHRPVFSWEAEKNRKEIPPGKESVISVKCFGRAYCTDGTMFISYSYTRRERESSSPPPSAFYTRQLLFPVLVTVYQMLECYGMNILPISALASAEGGSGEWDSLLAGVDEAGWSVLTLDVQNIYGLAFEVSLSYNSRVTTSRVIPPGSTYRLLLPIERFSLPAEVTTAPIPSLTNRQYVVSGLANEEDKAQRELFWHREELLKRVKASWKEAAGSRTGELSLRTQRFTQPMLNALRMGDIHIGLSLSGMDNSDGEVRQVASARGTYTVPPDRYSTVKAIVQNLTLSPLVLSLSLSAEPSDYFAYDDVLKDIPLGRLQSQESKEYEAVVVFLAQGTFKLSAQVRMVAIGQESRICGTGSIVVESQVE